MKHTLHATKESAEKWACCPEAISEGKGVFYVSKDCCGKEEKEFKIDDIKVTKEFKVQKDSK